MATYKDVKGAQDALMKKLNKLGHEVATEVFHTIIKDTPIDTTKCRGNWQSSVNEPKKTIVPDGEAIGRQEDTTQTVEKAGIKDAVYLTNNLPYVEALEYGWSSQRPSGWVRATVAQGQSIIDKKSKQIEGQD